MKLTEKQEKFAQLVANGERYFDAYKQSYKAGNMSNNSIYVNSSRLMDCTMVALRVKEIQAEYGEKLFKDKVADLNEILVMMTNRVRLDPRELYNADGSFKEMPELTLEQAQNLAEITVKEIFSDEVQVGRIVKVKLVDLKGIFDSFLKTFGAYIEKHQHSIDHDDLDYLRELLDGIKD